MRLRRLVPLLLAGGLSCSRDTTTAPPTGSLSVVVVGLPPGVPSAVIITGPNGYRAVADSTRTLQSLEPGAYQIEAASVSASGSRYAAQPVAQTVIVNGATSANTITYSVSSARLTVDVLGLPSGALANVDVTGPGGFSRTITSSTQFDLLEPGSYNIVASDVAASAKTYRPSVRTRRVDLSASPIPTVATIAYGAGTGVLDIQLTGLPVGVDAAVVVTGPGAYRQTVSTSTRLEQLEAGTYTISATLVGRDLTTFRPTSSSQSRSLTGSDSSSVVITYAGTPVELALQRFADGLTQPVFLTAPAGDARQFIVERVGRIRIVSDGVLNPTPFLDIRSRVNNIGERGMLSMAFDPAYATNGSFFVYYVDLAGNVTIEGFTSTPGSSVAGASTGLVITIPHGGNEHHGGLITFGLDGMLYLGVGDGGCCGDPNNNAQNLSTLLGKLLRFDVHARTSGRSDAPAQMWAYGLRNPWRYSFDAVDGLLYIGDVGNDAREEVNVVRANVQGLNYGWRQMEGLSCFLPATNCANGSLTLPVLDYPHTDGCSVTGGYVYRGAMIPELTGHYFYADYCRGWVRSFRALGSGTADRREWATIKLPGLLSFGVDGVGELYAISGATVWKVVRSN